LLKAKQVFLALKKRGTCNVLGGEYALRSSLANTITHENGDAILGLVKRQDALRS